MGSFIDLTGHRYGRLTVIERVGKNNTGQTTWKCVCDCGKEIIVVGARMRFGSVKSCGCLQREMASLANKTHGMTKSKLHVDWRAMRKRCFCKNDKAYKDYGGRGITVCDEWNDFMAFYEWSMNNGYSEELSLDRIDNDGNYCPENCRWTDSITQGNNKRNNFRVEYNGETKTLAEWSRITGIGSSTIKSRIISGWSIEDALFCKPKSSFEVNITYNGETHTLTEWSKITGISYSSLRGRRKMNWDVADMLTVQASSSNRYKNIKRNRDEIKEQ